MQTETKRRLLLGAAAAAVLALGGFLGVTNLTGHGIVPAEAAVANTTCFGIEVKTPSKIVYAAYAADEQGAFGTGKTYDTPDDAANAFLGHMVTDPVFTAVVVESPDHGMNLDVKATRKLAVTYVTDHNKWREAILSICAKVKSFTLKTYRGAYDTFGMHIGSKPTDMPALFKTSRDDIDLGQSFDVTWNSGTTSHYRTGCYFQLSQLK